MNAGICSPLRPVANALIRALKQLPTVASWSAIVAENAYWASYESFLQCSLLWSINTLDGSDFLSDREKLVTDGKKGATKPDHLFFLTNRRTDWLAAVRDGNRKELRRLGLGFACLKVAWSKGNATASSTIPGKVCDIVTDITKLRALEEIASAEQPDEHKELLVVIGCTGFGNEPAKSVEDVSSCEGELLATIQHRLCVESHRPVRLLETVWLAQDDRVTSISDRFVSIRASVLEVNAAE